MNNFNSSASLNQYQGVDAGSHPISTLVARVRMSPSEYRLLRPNGTFARARKFTGDVGRTHLEYFVADEQLSTFVSGTSWIKATNEHCHSVPVSVPGERDAQTTPILVHFD